MKQQEDSTTRNNLEKLGFVVVAGLAFATAYWARRKSSHQPTLVVSSVEESTPQPKRTKRIYSHALNLAQPLNKSTPHFLISKSLNEIPTPALLIDMDVLESNMDKMNRSVEKFDASVRLRPHYKAHKCPNLAFLQNEVHSQRFNGVCCQKLSEAESVILDMEFPVNDVFIANEVVEPLKLQRIAKMISTMPEINLSLTVDNAEVVKQLAEICKQQKSQTGSFKKIGLVIEYNVGQNRCGVNSVAELIELAKFIALDQLCSKYVYLKGIQCYQGANQHIRDWNAKKEAVEKVNTLAREAKAALEQEGLVSKDFIITGAGTGTYLVEGASGVFNELQPGSYLFMDADYNRNMAASGKTYEEDTDVFKQSLFVLSTVMSKAKNNKRAVLDAGMKAVSLDSGVPVLNDNKLRSNLFYKPGGDEHGILLPLDENTETSEIDNLQVGDKVKLIPGHCDPTVNMYDWFICIRNDRVVDVWPIAGRSSGL